MKIVNVESGGYDPKAHETLRSLGEVVLADADRGELLRLVKDAEILIVRLRHAIDREVFEAAPHLKVVVTATTGLNHLDLDAARTRGVEVLSLRGEQEFLANVTATAELTWGLLLSLTRRVPAAVGHVVSGNWDRDLFKGRELKNKLLGIVGFGRLGRIVADYARAFRMTVAATDPFVSTFPDWVRNLSFDELLAKADVLTVHVPLNQDTKSMFGAKEFSRMKEGAIFLNTSRGELVDETSLIEALESGKLAGAGLDVVCNEPANSNRLTPGNPLIAYATRHENLVVTPHIGGATHESMRDTERFMAEKLASYVKNRPIAH